MVADLLSHAYQRASMHWRRDQESAAANVRQNLRPTPVASGWFDLRSARPDRQNLKFGGLWNSIFPYGIFMTNSDFTTES
jgi:hypothetical protein